MAVQNDGPFHRRRRAAPEAAFVTLSVVARLRCPHNQLALLDLIQLVADLAPVLRLSHQEKKYVMKYVVCYEQRDDNRHDQLKR